MICANLQIKLAWEILFRSSGSVITAFIIITYTTIYIFIITWLKEEKKKQ